MKHIKIGAINSKEDLFLANQLASILLKNAWNTKIVPLDLPEKAGKMTQCKWIENQLVFDRADILVSYKSICEEFMSEHVDRITIKAKEWIEKSTHIENSDTNVIFVITFLKKTKSGLVLKAFSEITPF